MNTETRYFWTGEREEDGKTLIRFPDVPEALTEVDAGATLTDMFKAAEDALVTALGGYLEDGRPFPDSVSRDGFPADVPTLENAKIALHFAMRERKVSGRELARRLDIHETAVRRLLDLGHRSHISEVEAALRVLGMRMSTSVVVDEWRNAEIGNDRPESPQNWSMSA